MNRRYLIAGTVQGVGFRYFAARQATRLGLTGWVRNLPDGRVEVEAQGPAEALAELERALRQGPQRARITGLETSEISGEPTPPNTFDIR